jgi:transglutaminase-like putative cysteine protease
LLDIERPFQLTWQLGSVPRSSYAQSTLAHVRALARRDAVHPDVRLLAQELTIGQLPYDNMSEAEALHAFVRDDIRYVRDVQGVETVQSPRLTLRVGSGDCDDKTALLASLLYSIGFKVRFCLAATMRRLPGQFTHIYPEANVQGRWVPLETIIPGLPAGRALPSSRTHKES